MMFIVRTGGLPPQMPGIVVKLSRQTPAYVGSGAGQTDFFCLGDEAAIAALRAGGGTVVELRDGYYEDGRGGGVAIWGQGRYWEIRETPFTVRDAAGPSGNPAEPAAEGEQVNVRRAIFGA